MHKAEPSSKIDVGQAILPADALSSASRRRLESRRQPGLAAPQPGVTVVIPSRTGKELLQAQLPGLLAQGPEQIVVVDNGSTDGTAEWVARDYPQIEVVHSAAPLSFARAVNLGIARARSPHVCLLNNDMLDRKSTRLNSSHR